MNLRKSLEDALIVSVSFHPGADTGVLIVGRQKKGEGMKIINAFQGEEARELYDKLTTQKKKE